MSTQATDNLLLNGKKYSITNSTEIIFNAFEHGFTHFGFNSACLRGFKCNFNFVDNKLNLETLFVSANDYDEIPDEFHGSVMEKKTPDELFSDPEFFKNLMMFPYKNVNIPIGFSGKMILGHDFDCKVLNYSGFPRAYGYRELLEATFEDGILKDIKDISTATEEINNSLPEDYVPFIIAFEPAPISKDLIEKYWWLKEE